MTPAHARFVLGWIATLLLLVPLVAVFILRELAEIVAYCLGWLLNESLEWGDCI